MDPVSHLLLARMVAALRPARALPRGVVAATVLGGLAPDVDAALMAVGWDVYLRWHELGTHSLAGSPLVALLTAGVVRTWAPQASLGALAFGAWLGVLSHVFFDVYSGAGIRLLWPLSERVMTAPVVAMADPLAIAVLVVGAVALWVWPRVPRTAATLVLVLLALLSGVKLVTRARATAAYEAAAASAGPAPTRVAVEAVWGSWRAWSFVDRLADGTLRAWQADGVVPGARLRFSQPPATDAPFARASLADFATARNFVPVHPFAFATVRDDDAGHVVFWSDARFCWTPSEQADAQDDVPHQDVRPARGPLRCALWFGGSYDAQGRPYEALIWLGGHLQRRSPQRWGIGL
ncbi:hypothetical protein TBR22_A45240 [Luteitalea sp. TBR-22]|uniref:metal-dependent hydrolase n=1 Tax=Luteitalea sp. TBR-22 TaxID=2802971 RepID=UPI001AF254D0|nr:metal-dependent hydrolase [Luteitalea sp. TBR-22]BCS35297.1 hypothetical protein TBR22_A45240 [Luteitalea sp. TBR-22]